MAIQNTLNYISQQFHIYFGLCILILGVLGGIANVIIFTTLKTFRETSCAFYLIIVSIVNIGQLLTSLLIRILSAGFSTDIREISWVCKIQTYIVTWFTLLSIIGICCATIDQYVSMSKYRRFSSLYFAQRCMLVVSIFSGLYSIPVFIYSDSLESTCKYIISSFVIYYSRFHFPVLIGFLPIIIMVTFALLAFNSARTLASRQVNIVRLSRDRQLTAMTLVHVTFVVITILPFTVFFIYFTNVLVKDLEQIALNNLIYTITVLAYYSSFSGSFYIYYCVSDRFRKQFIYVLMKICINQQGEQIHTLGGNQVAPSKETIVGGQQSKEIKKDSINISLKS